MNDSDYRLACSSNDNGDKYSNMLVNLKKDIETNRVSFIEKYTEEISYFFRIFLKETENSKYLDLICERWKLDVFTLISDTIKSKI